MAKTRIPVSKSAVRRAGKALLLALLFLSVRLPVALSSPRIVEPEELYVGTIAREILLGDYPCAFFELQYGDHDFGSLVNGVLAVGLFSVFGSSALTLQILALGFALVAFFASMRIATHIGGKSAERIAALFLLLPPPILVRASLSAQGNHGEAIAFSAVALLATLGVLSHDSSDQTTGRSRHSIGMRLALIGLVLGAGVTYYYGFLLAAAAVLVLLLGTRPSPLLGRKALLLVAGFALGAAPWGYSAVAVGQASLDRPISASRAALGLAPSAGSARTTPWTEALKDAGRDLVGVLGRDLPEAFTARWPASSPFGKTLSRAVSLERSHISARSPETGRKPPAERLRSRTPAGLTWYLICVLGILGLVVAEILARPSRTHKPNQETARKAGVLATAGGVPLLFLTIIALGYAISPQSVPEKSLMLYPGDEYIPYRYLVSAVWMLLLGAAVALGMALDARSRALRSFGVAALVSAAFLGTVSFLAYLDDPLFPWDPSRTARQKGTNYAPLGIKLARNAERERAESVARFSAGERLDPGAWVSFQRLDAWTERRGGREAEMMVAHYLTDLLAQPDQPAPERNEAYLAELHRLCGELTEPARSRFCHILLAGFPPPALAKRRPTPPQRINPPFPKRPHPVCRHLGCCGDRSEARD
ncbi:MAG: hypothetical protein CME06_18080 [Gemmatimonadetes bacterium]|nr:hypothetical protein [Gemmatimonadota bacterium]